MSALVLGTCASTPRIGPPETGIPDALTEPLFRFVRFEDGTYGYDRRQPVAYSRFSDETVRIPRELPPAKTGFRGVWVATVLNLNIPRARSAEHFKEEYLRILDTLADWNMNAVIFQVRPMLDAFYPSRINPWSQFLTGRQGQEPAWLADWDPLEWMVAEAHARGIEFHAWFNPYRVTSSGPQELSVPGFAPADLARMTAPDLVSALVSGGILSPENFAVRNPRFTYVYNGRLYLDAGRPEVRRHVVDTVMEVVRGYDVDAVHFDDYFYPYRAGARAFGGAGEDRETFDLYGAGRFADTARGMDAWRRENNTDLIRAVRGAISAENRRSMRAVQFGISPFGIWEHAQNDPRGSNTPTGSGSTYSGQVFADTLLWVREELIDYIVPQVYWSFDQGAAPYAELVRWWSSAVEGRNVNLYIGHANYKHLDSAAMEPAWMNPEEIPNQLRYNRTLPAVSGNAFFSFSRLLEVPGTGPVERAANEAIRLLKADLAAHKTLPPPKPWLDRRLPAPPAAAARRGDTLTWRTAAGGNTGYFVVYRFPAPGPFRRPDLARITADPTNIVALVRKGGTVHTFTDTALAGLPGRYGYAVTALSAAGLESAASLARGR